MIQLHVALWVEWLAIPFAQQCANTELQNPSAKQVHCKKLHVSLNFLCLQKKTHHASRLDLVQIRTKGIEPGPPSRSERCGRTRTNSKRARTALLHEGLVPEGRLLAPRDGRCVAVRSMRLDRTRMTEVLLVTRHLSLGEGVGCSVLKTEKIGWLKMTFYIQLNSGA